MKRSALKKTTREAKVIRYLRMAKRISMREAGKRCHVSDSLISHLEQGRLDLSEERIKQLVAAYGYTYQDFQVILASSDTPLFNLKDECIQLIDQVDPIKLPAIHAVLKGFLL